MVKEKNISENKIKQMCGPEMKLEGNAKNCIKGEFTIQILQLLL
jgi:hypothetical protein